MESFTPTVARGQSGRVVLQLTASRRVVSATVDLIGDGDDGWTVNGDDLAALGGLRYTPGRAGLFNLIVTARDVAGCVGTTGAPRPVRVTP